MKWGGEHRTEREFFVWVIIAVATCVSIAFMLAMCWLTFQFIAH